MRKVGNNSRVSTWGWNYCWNASFELCPADGCMEGVHSLYVSVSHARLWILQGQKRIWIILVHPMSSTIPAYNRHLITIRWIIFFFIDSLGTRTLWSLVHHPFIQLASPKTWNHSWPSSLLTPHIWPMNKLCLYYLQNTFLNSWLLSTSTMSSLIQDTLSPRNYSKCPLIIHHFHSHHANPQGPEWVSFSSAQNLPGVPTSLTAKANVLTKNDKTWMDTSLSYSLFSSHTGLLAVLQNTSKLPSQNFGPFCSLCLE